MAESEPEIPQAAFTASPDLGFESTEVAAGTK